MAKARAGAQRPSDGSLPAADPAGAVARLQVTAQEIRPEQRLKRILSLGSELMGRPIVLVEPAEDGEPGLPSGAHIRSRERLALTGVDGEPIGELQALDIRARPAFTPAEDRRFAEIARLVAGDHEARSLTGRVDHVTGLPNRIQFLRDMEARSAAADQPAAGRMLVLVTLADARQFNEILRALGHACADAFVRAGAARIRETVGEERDLYHVSVLSFAFVAASPSADGLPAEVAALIARFSRPLVCRDIPITTRVGIGLAQLGEEAFSAEQLRTALAAAQDSRRREEGYAFYDRRSDEAHRRAFALLHDLELALREDDQLSLHFQPRMNLATGRCDGAEALLRWRHPGFGPISPGEFIPLAEATALITPLTQWVLREAGRQTAAWRDRGIDVKLSANVSPHNLQEPSLPALLAELIGAGRIAPDRFEIEFTESALTNRDAGVRRQLDSIHDLGIDIAIDDFGTGYSNMNYLLDLPANVLKIDQSFVRTLFAEPRSQLLVRSMIDIAHGFGLRTVVEGIEDQEALALTRSWGCDEAQGYHIGRPMTAEAFVAWWLLQAA